MNDLAAKQSADGKKAASRQVLTFTLGTETFAVDVLKVKEIRDWAPVTRLPRTPAHVLGVLSLRGMVVPIIDLRRRFNLAAAEFTPLTVIIVMSAATASGRQDFGVVVDGVSDVVNIAADDIRKTPHLAAKMDSEFIQSLAMLGDRMLILLDVDALLGRAAASDEAQGASSAA
jgi:purine-binding chemotaxis protein CheW